MPQTPLSADIGFPKKEKGTKAKEEAIGRFGGLILSPLLPLSLSLSLSFYTRIPSRLSSSRVYKPEM